MKDKDYSLQKANTFVATVDTKLAPQMVEELKLKGFDISYPEYTLFSAKKKGVSCTLYSSGKLTVQGKEKDSFIEFYIEPQILKTFSHSYPNLELNLEARIGIDESGKGDFFGPLCVAGVFAEGDSILKLKQMGVKDSKKLSPESIKKIGQKIRAEYLHCIVKINPPKYNQIIKQFGNLNHLLAWGHATAIERLSQETSCRKVIVDQFANERVVLTALKRKDLSLDVFQRHRAEEDIVVAAASILARFTFVEALDELERQFEQAFPKGASRQTIEAGKKFVRKYGKENLEKVGKLHFKTVDAILKEISE